MRRGSGERAIGAWQPQSEEGEIERACCLCGGLAAVRRSDGEMWLSVKGDDGKFTYFLSSSAIRSEFDFGYCPYLDMILFELCIMSVQLKWSYANITMKRKSDLLNPITEGLYFATFVWAASGKVHYWYSVDVFAESLALRLI